MSTDPNIGHADSNSPRVPTSFFVNADGSADFLIETDDGSGFLVRFANRSALQKWAEDLTYLVRRAEPALFQSASAQFEAYSLRPAPPRP